MRTAVIEADVVEDGYIRIDIPMGLQPGKFQVLIVVEESPDTKTVKTNGKRNGDKNLSQSELANELLLLLEPLKNVSLREIKQGRQDCEHRH